MPAGKACNAEKAHEYPILWSSNALCDGRLLGFLKTAPSRKGAFPAGAEDPVRKTVST